MSEVPIPVRLFSLAVDLWLIAGLWFGWHEMWLAFSTDHLPVGEAFRKALEGEGIGNVKTDVFCQSMVLIPMLLGLHRFLPGPGLSGLSLLRLDGKPASLADFLVRHVLLAGWLGGAMLVGRCLTGHEARFGAFRWAWDEHDILCGLVGSGLVLTLAHDGIALLFHRALWLDRATRTQVRLQPDAPARWKRTLHALENVSVFTFALFLLAFGVLLCVAL
jgi:hypothetical protein